jgi:uncharacterized protein
MADVRENLVFSSGGVRCAAWLYRPVGSVAPAPCVVMAHGFGLTRDACLERYADRFAKSGLAVLVFDYRHFGDSEGSPRQLFSIRRQLEDWRCAIRFARGHPGIDSERILLWGTSFSGGHVIRIAAEDQRVAAISAQVPMCDALAATGAYVRSAGFGRFLQLGVYGILDQLRAAVGMRPLRIRIAGEAGLRAVASPDADVGYRSITPAGWTNELCARYALNISLYRPVTWASRVRCPALIQICTRDAIVPPPAAIRTADRIGRDATVSRFECRHFDIYSGPHFERACDDQTRFFSEAAGIHAG